MSPLRFSLIVASLLLMFPPKFVAQQNTTVMPQRDPQAVALLQGAVRAMGGNVPQDSVAIGSVTIVAGSQTSTGTIHILTKGTDQTSEQIQLPEETRTVTYSQGLAEETTGQTKLDYSLELTLSSQSPCFPLPLLAGAFGNPDEAIEYLGSETLNERPVYHLRVWNTFASKPDFQNFSANTSFDLWLDAGSSLPLRIFRVLRSGSGDFPGVPLDVIFSNYQNVGGVLYPFSIQESLNGTPWKTVAISNVSFNTGLTDSSFSVD